MGLYYSPPPPFMGGRQPLEPKKLTPPSQTVSAKTPIGRQLPPGLLNWFSTGTTFQTQVFTPIASPVVSRPAFTRTPDAIAISWASAQPLQPQRLTAPASPVVANPTFTGLPVSVRLSWLVVAPNVVQQTKLTPPQASLDVPGITPQPIGLAWQQPIYPIQASPRVMIAAPVPSLSGMPQAVLNSWLLPAPLLETSPPQTINPEAPPPLNTPESIWLSWLIEQPAAIIGPESPQPPVVAVSFVPPPLAPYIEWSSAPFYQPAPVLLTASAAAATPPPPIGAAVPQAVLNAWLPPEPPPIIGVMRQTISGTSAAVLVPIGSYVPQAVLDNWLPISWQPSVTLSQPPAAQTQIASSQEQLAALIAWHASQELYVGPSGPLSRLPVPVPPQAAATISGFPSAILQWWEIAAAFERQQPASPQQPTGSFASAVRHDEVLLAWLPEHVTQRVVSQFTPSGPPPQNPPFMGGARVPPGVLAFWEAPPPAPIYAPPFIRIEFAAVPQRIRAKVTVTTITGDVFVSPFSATTTVVDRRVVKQ